MLQINIDQRLDLVEAFDPSKAISPQIPEGLVEIKRRRDLGFTVASDPGNTLGRALGLTYEANQASRDTATGRGSWIGEIIGTGTWELPQPSVIIIDSDRKARFVEISPDWLVRTEAPAILDALRQTTVKAAA